MAGQHKIENEPAFPCGSGDLRDPSGMTLRDYFAAKAMAQLICAIESKNTTSTFCVNETNVTRKAYEIADAMLKARSL